jgi:hypothetical protein
VTGELYLRRARVQVGTVVVTHDSDESLRIAFRVSKNPWATEPNTATIDIWNLADYRREMLNLLVTQMQADPNGRGAPVVIEAGYANALPTATGTIFKGNLRSVAHSRESVGVRTRILAGSYVSSQVPVVANYPAGVNAGQVAVDLLNKIKAQIIDVDIIGAVASALNGDLSGVKAQFSNAFAVEGKAMQELQTVVGEHGYQVSEQDGKIIMLKVGEAGVGRSVILNPSSGLVGTVDPVSDTRRPGVFLVRMRSLMRHDIDVGTAIQLDSLSTKGLFVSEIVEHNGDTYGGSEGYLTTVEGRSLKGRVA